MLYVQLGIKRLLCDGKSYIQFSKRRFLSVDQWRIIKTQSDNFQARRKKISFLIPRILMPIKQTHDIIVDKLGHANCPKRSRARPLQISPGYARWAIFNAAL